MNRPFEGKRFLLTGATGFIGRVLLKRLKENGAFVFSLARGGADSIECDLRDPEMTRRAIGAKPFDGVFHLAAAGVTPGRGLNEESIQWNEEMTVNLLLALEEISPCPVIVAGSWTEYGVLENGIASEEAECHPLSLYGRSKLRSTQAACAWSIRTQRPLTVLRFFSVYGAGEPPHRLGPTIISALQRNEAPNLGLPDQIRDFVYVDDVAEGCIRALALQEPGLLLNVGTGIGTTVRDYSDLIRSEMHSSIAPIWGRGEPRPWDVQAVVARTDRLKEKLGWIPQILPAEGVYRMLRSL
ncbi:MAG TPA: NAD(P)-dependent oxidoreductase [Patescibacteria group bacterium]|nr:NAD(P)-dependent oxidoreductase [Patescibacteria group bacterium]